MREDLIVNEVRQARLTIEQECNNDFHQIYERALKIQKQLAEKRANDKKAPEETELLAA